MRDIYYKKMHEIETTHWWFQAKKDIIMHVVRKIVSNFTNKNIKIADFGCGVGLLLNPLAEIADITGIDYSEQAINYCKKVFSGKLVNENLGKPIRIKETFDIVIASDVIEHIEDDKTAIINIFNALNNNGYAIITVPAFNFLWSQHDVNNMHYRRYNLDSLKELIKDLDFEIKYISYFNFFMFVPAVLVRLLKKAFKFDKNCNIELNPPTKFINNILYKIFYSEHNYIGKKRFPFGLSLIAILKKK